MKQPVSPTLEQHGWELENAAQRHMQFPDTFHIPDLAERSTLAEGRRAQLLFLFSTEEDGKPVIQCEKMWVTIQTCVEDRYEGCLNSCSVTSSAVKPGDTITFGPEHIASVLIPKTDPRHPEYRG